MSRRTRPFNDQDFDDLHEGRPSKSEQKRHVQRMAALAEQLSELPLKQLQALPVEERLIEAFSDLSTITSFEARRRQFQRIAKLLRNEDETILLACLIPKQGAKKQAQLLRWVERVIEQGDSAINDFCKQYQAAERHTLRQHVLRYQRALKQHHSEASHVQVDRLSSDHDDRDDQLDQLKQQIINYMQQTALLSE